MKKLIALLTLVAAASAYSQGTVNFNNKVATATPAINAPISYAAGGPATAGNINGGGTVALINGKDWGGKYAMAALYGGATADVNAMTLLVPAVGFRSTSAAAYGLVNVGAAGERTVPGVLAGSSAFVQVRAWDAGIAGISTYEAARQQSEYYSGVSSVMRVVLGGGSPPIATPNLVDADTGVALAAFSITYVPEPSIIGLGILGAAAALVVFRRRE